MLHLIKQVMILSDDFKHRFPQRSCGHDCRPFLSTALVALSLNTLLLFGKGENLDA